MTSSNPAKGARFVKYARVSVTHHPHELLERVRRGVAMKTSANRLSFAAVAFAAAAVALFVSMLVAGPARAADAATPVTAYVETLE